MTGDERAICVVIWLTMTGFLYLAAHLIVTALS